MPKITFFPPSHEQLPSFHVPQGLLQPLLDALKKAGIAVWEEPQNIESAAGEESEALSEVRLKPGTPNEELQKFADIFNRNHGG